MPILSAVEIMEYGKVVIIMLLKKTIQYREKGLIFPRTKLPEPIDVRRSLLACQICSFYTDREACYLKHQMGIKVSDLKCGFDNFCSYLSKKVKRTRPKTSYAYVAKEGPDM